MAWKRNLQNHSQIQELGFLTARLLRLTAFTKLARGEAQLRAAGVPANFSIVYKDYLKNELRQNKLRGEEQEEESLLVVKDKSKF